MPPSPLWDISSSPTHKGNTFVREERAWSALLRGKSPSPSSPLLRRDRKAANHVGRLAPSREHPPWERSYSTSQHCPRAEQASYTMCPLAPALLTQLASIFGALSPPKSEEFSLMVLQSVRWKRNGITAYFCLK